MSGGLVQLFSTGIEDTIMTRDANVTLFKIKYRRHSNFSMEDHSLNFKKKLDFGTKSWCHLENYGDLVYKMYLVLELPKLDLYNKIITKLDVINLMNQYGMTVTFNNIHTGINNDDIDMLRTILINQLNKLTIDLENYNETLTIITTILNPTIHNDLLLLSINDYKNYISQKLTNNEILYSFIIATLNDNSTPSNIMNYSDILTSFMNNLSHSFINVPETSYLVDNYDFISNIEFSAFNSQTSNNANIIFSDVISKYYTNDDYKNLDAYKIFIKYLDTIILTGQPTDNDIYSIKSQLLFTIVNNMIYNDTALYDIFDLLNTNANIPIYKKYKGSGKNVSETLKFTTYLNDSYLFYKISNYETNFTFDYGNQIKNLFVSLKNNLINKMSGIIDTYISTYLNDLLQNITFNQLMPSVATSFTNGSSILKVIFLNFIPTITLSSIIQTLNEYLAYKLNNISDPDQLYETSFNDISIYLTSLSSTISSQVGTILAPSSDEIREIIRNVVNMNTTDTIVYSNYKIYSSNPMNYIKTNYQQIITFVTNILPYPSSTTTATIILDVTEIINSFFSETLPSYTSYKSNNYRIYNYGNLDTTEVFDVFSSFWYILENYYQEEYDNFFTNTFSYANSLGSEMSLYIDELLYSSSSIINSRLFDLSGNIMQSYLNNYFEFARDVAYNNALLLDPTGAAQSSTEILNYIVDKQNMLETLNENYNKYKILLNGRFITLSARQYYYESVDIILDDLVNVMINNNLYGYGSDITYNNELTDLITTAKNDTINIKNVKDVLNDLLTSYTNYLTNEPGLIFTPNILTWYNTFVVSLTPVEISNLITSATLFFNTITANYLYNDINTIINLYDNFENENNFYQYLSNVLLNTNIYASDIVNYMNTQEYLTIENVYESINTYVTNKITNIQNTISDIDKPNNVSEYKLITIIINGLKKNKGTYGWINEIGHGIIEKISLEIGGVVIDEHCDDLLHLISNLRIDKNLIRGYNKLIGNYSELFDVNTKTKKQTKLYIPINFWFCNNVNSSLPLVALSNTEVNIHVSLRKLTDVINAISNVDMSNIHLINAYILAQYIYVENTERKAICQNKLEHLIEIYQTIKIGTLTYNNILFDFENNGTITVKLNFTELSKELIWFVQINDNGNWTDYTNNGKKLLTKSKILFNNRERDTFYYEHSNLIFPYERYKTAVDLGMHVYPFSLYPLLLQPSGSANLSKLYDCKLILYLDNELIELMRNGKTIRISVYSLTYNLLRIVSGLAGLLFMASETT